MSAQPSTQIAEPPIWSGWQNAVINGVYPLHRLLHGSQHSAVFLTERKGQSVADAALKIIPIERVTLAQLSHWRIATELSHPHLIRMFDAGLCHLAGRQFLFVVMEYAQQTLAEVLDRRALTEDEVRELLAPTLEALTFLHGERLVLARLKPANVLVVDDQLKLASDSIRPTGAPRVGFAESSIYDAPEANELPFSGADDVWGLGVMLVEALTQRLPSPDAQSGAARLPDAVPAAFAGTLQRCLRYDPAARPRSTDLEAQFAGAPETPVLPVAAALASEVPPIPIAAASASEAARPAEPPTPEYTAPRSRMPVLAAMAALVLLAAAWTGLRLLHRQPAPAQVAAVPDSVPVQAPVAVKPPAAPTAIPSGPAVLHKQLPEVSRSALGTIRGHVKVVVVAIVDRSGNVIETRMKNAGPSAYFAGRAREAARQWKFAPTQDQGTRQWLLRFEFARGSITDSATPGS